MEAMDLLSALMKFLWACSSYAADTIFNPRSGLIFIPFLVVAAFAYTVLS